MNVENSVNRGVAGRATRGTSVLLVLLSSGDIVAGMVVVFTVSLDVLIILLVFCGSIIEMSEWLCMSMEELKASSLGGPR